MVFYQHDGIVLRKGHTEKQLPKLRDASFDLAIVDMPYGVTQNHWDRPVDLSWLWNELHRVTTTSAAIICFAQGLFAVDLINSNHKEFRYDLVWEKDRPSGFLNSGRMPLRSHEQMLVFYRKLPTYNAQMTQGEPEHGTGKRSKGVRLRNYGSYEGVVSDGGNTSKHPRSVLRFARPHPMVHPTQKPVKLIEWLVRTYSNESNRVLDPYVGSGTTLVACKNTGRRAVGIEGDPAMCKMAVERLSE